MGIRFLAWAAVAAFALGGGAAPAFAKTVLILPVQGETEKMADLAAVNELFKEAVRNAYPGDAITPSDSAHQCGDKGCAVELAKAAKADEAVYTVLRRLGGKWIFSSTIVEASGGNLFNERGTALNVEDLEAVTRRVGEAVVARKTFEQVANVDNITQKEEEQEPTRRRSLYAGGLALGFLYPTDHSYAYLETKSDGSRNEVQRWAMTKVVWLNTWEFKQNMILGFDAVWAFPSAVGGDLNLQYLFNRTDFTPFVGGGVGTHWSLPDEDGPDSKMNAGPALNVQGGMILFRTYDVHVQVRGQYHAVFNSDKEFAPSFDVGVVYQRKEKAGQSANSSGSAWRPILLGVLALFVLGAMVDND
jgi:hypothetical protein